MNAPRQHRFDPYTAYPITGYYAQPAQEIPIVADVDVLVVGGSQSGCAAAICAARHGAKVLLVERFGFLGGQSVYGSVVQWEKRAFINNLGAVATRGIALEMLQRILAKGDSDGLWPLPPGCPEMRDGEEWLNVEAIPLVLLEMCAEAHVDLLLHTMAADVIADRPSGGRPRLHGVILENKTGRMAVTARVVIDATADLDLVWRAIGEAGCGLRAPQERQSAGYYVWFGDVDNERFGEHVLSSAGYTGYPDPAQFPDRVRQHLHEGKLVYVHGFSDILAQAEECGLLAPVNELLASMGQPPLSGLYAKSVGRGRWATSLSSVRGVNLLDAWELTRYEAWRIELTHAMLPVMRLIPGWENCYIARSNLYLGSRETRYLKAERMLGVADIFAPSYETQPDTVGRSGGHDPGKNRLAMAYPIPYGMLIPARLDATLCCTRAVGAEPGIPLDAHRGIVPTIVVGQAAGTAAALAVQQGVEPRDIDLAALQATLRGDDVVLDVERAQFPFEIPQDRIRPWPAAAQSTADHR